MARVTNPETQHNFGYARRRHAEWAKCATWHCALLHGLFETARQSNGPPLGLSPRLMQEEFLATTRTPGVTVLADSRRFRSAIL